jgi:hypothetical protein
LRVAHGATLSVLLTGPSDTLPALRAQVEEELALLPPSGKIEFVTGPPLALLAGSSLRSRALVLSGALVRSDRRALKALVEASAAPLILVG